MPRTCRHVVPQRFLPIPTEVEDFLFADLASPSLLRWKSDRGNHVKAGAVAGTQRPDGRWRVRVCNRFYYTYRIYFFLQNKADLAGVLVDHRNNDASCHSPDNLRIATRAQNNANRRPKSKYKGVSFHPASNTWRARVCVNRKEKTTYHRTPEEAALAYDRLAIEAHGEFAYLNFPEQAHVHSS
jgi:hypothetical protein